MSKEQKAQAPKEQVVHLYEGGKRIHPKLAKGRFANWRIFAIVATQFVFYVLPWFNWSGRQAVLFDIPERHFYIFCHVFSSVEYLYVCITDFRVL